MYSRPRPGLIVLGYLILLAAPGLAGRPPSASREAAGGPPPDPAEVYNVRAARYGARGDGVADDRAAIQAALNEAERSPRGGVVYLPPGRYRVTPPGLSVGLHTSLVGAGPWASAVYYPGGSGDALTAGAPDFRGSSPPTWHGRVEELMVEGASSRNRATGIRVVKCLRGRVHRLFIRGIGTAVVLDGGAPAPGREWTGLHFISDLLTSNVTNGLLFQDWVTHTTVLHAELSGKGGPPGARVGTGLRLTDRTATCHFFGVNVEAFGTGYRLETTGASGSDFVSCREEHNDTPIAWAGNPRGYTFLGGNGIFATPSPAAGPDFWNGLAANQGESTLLERDGCFPTVTRLPPASAAHRKQVLRTLGGPGEPDTLSVCLKDRDGTHRWQNLLAPAGPGGPSLLACRQYCPAAATALASARQNNTFQEVDRANLAVTFTAPASGKVLARLTGVAGRSANSVQRVYWGLSDGNGLVAGSGGEVLSGTGAALSVSQAAVVTGLTPGRSYTWKWAHRPDTAAAAARAKLYVGGDPAAGGYGPAVMEVWGL